MADQAALWRWVVSALDKQQPAALLLVADSRGSSPGTQGDKMAVTMHDCIGTIGGGMIETSITALARSLLSEGSCQPRLVSRAHHASKTVRRSGMICGGEQTVLVYPCKQSDKPLFERLIFSCDRCQPSLLQLTARGLEVLPHAPPLSEPAFENGEYWRYRENIGYCKRAYIIGGGHVGLALSRILATLDFDITVIDERESVRTMQDNAYAQHKYCLPYRNIGQHIPEGRNVYAFIMAHSHHDDQLIVTELAAKQLAYLGLLGSQHKIDFIKQALAGKLPDECWQTIHAPMGLAIGSHSPEEIAVSIAAEVIQTRNRKN
ncbi:MAG: XdhC family protein [Methylomonas sp.]|nr:XdhC family protein [Methylomonas sp.]